MIAKLMHAAANVVGFVPRYFDKLAAQNKLAFMTDTALMERINDDAAESRINTEYSQEYDRRHGRVN